MNTEVEPYPKGGVRYRQATPDDVEQRLYGLTRELDAATVDITQAENDYLHSKVAYELAYAKAYMLSGGKTMKDRECEALLKCQNEREDLVRSEALLKAHKENAKRIYTHVDIARSVSVIVRAGIGATQ